MVGVGWRFFLGKIEVQRDLAQLQIFCFDILLRGMNSHSISTELPPFVTKFGFLVII